MISVIIKGGLGNQMFQYALGRSLALEMNTELNLDTSFYSKYPNENRNFELNQFCIKFDSFNCNFLFPGRTIIERLFIPQKIMHITEDPSLYFNFDKRLNNLKYNAHYSLDGYWQAESYFLKYQKTIKDEFTLKNDIGEQNRLFLTTNSLSKTISVHIRRTDYLVENQTLICDFDYYNKAIKMLNSILDEKYQYIFFSDDIEWTKENFRHIENAIFVDWNNNMTHDMYLMSECTHNIISNSSFSWWATYLNKNVNKIVVSPKKWSNLPNIEKYSIISKDWILI